jgi:hypothetical protein
MVFGLDRWVDGGVMRLCLCVGFGLGVGIDRWMGGGIGGIGGWMDFQTWTL